MKVSEARVWVNGVTKGIMVVDHVQPPGFRRSEGSSEHVGWCDPIGAAYSDWLKASDEERIALMLETVIDLVMDGFDCATVLREFAKVEEFKALGRESYPMCRALTGAIVGKRLEPNTMTFDELLVAYGTGAATA